MSADVLREIPVIKTILAAANAVRSIRDEMLQKLSIMLAALADVPQEDRQRMVARLELDAKFAHRVRRYQLKR